MSLKKCSDAISSGKPSEEHKNKFLPWSEMERRGQERFGVSHGVYIALDNGQPIVGWVRDISLGGLTFEYIKEANLPMKAYGRIELFATDKDFYIPGLPAHVVYETAVKKDPQFEAFSGTDMYQCGIKFGTMRAGQIDQLVRFIEAHATKENENRCPD